MNDDLWNIAKVALATLCALCILMGCGGQRRTILARICFPERYHAQQRARRALAERQQQQASTTSQNTSNTRSATHDRGIIATQAGLQGVLTYAEREKMLERIFEERMLTYAQVSSTSEAATKTQDSQKDAPNKTISEAENSTTSCSICLTEYTHKDKRLVRGMHCEHVHHYECLIEWMKQPTHAADLCPYCRQPLFTPDQMRTAARGVIGTARVERGAAAVVNQTPTTTTNTDGSRTSNPPLPTPIDDDVELGTNNRNS